MSTSTRLSVNGQKGFAHLILILLLVVLAVLAAVLVFQGNIKLPAQVKVPGVTSPSKEPAVSLKQEYKNPFDKNAQYVNPFSEYKNPFDNLR